MSYVPSGHLPEGHLPDGHLPEEEQSSTYPTVSAGRSIRLPAGGIWVIDPDVTAWCEVIWADVLPAGVTLTSVAYGLPPVLTLVDEAVEQTLGKSAVKITGATHASMHQIGVVATLSNGMTLTFTPPMRCFNG